MMKKTAKSILKSLLFSKYIYPVFRRAYYIKFRLTGGVGGKAAQKYLKQLDQTEFASLDEIETIQNNKLKKLVREVYCNVPYYRKIMDQKSIKPSDIKSKEDLQVFPILTKQEIRENFDDLVNVKYKKKKLILITTGGTTGKPMKFYFSKHEYAVRSSHWERWKKFAGVKQFDKFMYIGMDVNAKRNPNYNGTFTPSGYYLMASFSVNDEIFWKYWENIEKFKPVYLRGYASGCYLLADFFRRNKIDYPLKAVLTSSDTLYPYQRKIIEDAFSCKVFDHYGLNEDAVIATECEYHDGFHINMESCIVEIVESQGNPVKKGEIGTIIGTSLENYCMPLIRYDTDDLGCFTYEKCVCGRNHIRIKQLFGRKDDILIMPDGKKAAVGNMSYPMKYLYNEILEVQFVQETKDLLIVNLVPTDKYTLETEREFEKHIRDQVGDLIKIKFHKMSEIPKTQRGKHRLIISKLKTN